MCPIIFFLCCPLFSPYVFHSFPLWFRFCQKDDDFEARPEVRRSLLLNQSSSSKSGVAALAKHKEAGKETQNNGGLLRSGSSRMTSRQEKEQDKAALKAKKAAVLVAATSLVQISLQKKEGGVVLTMDEALALAEQTIDDEANKLNASKNTSKNTSKKNRTVMGVVVDVAGMEEYKQQLDSSGVVTNEFVPQCFTLPDTNMPGWL